MRTLKSRLRRGSDDSSGPMRLAEPWTCVLLNTAVDPLGSCCISQMLSVGLKAMQLAKSDERQDCMTGRYLAGGKNACGILQVSLDV